MKVYFTLFVAIIAAALFISCANQKNDEEVEKVEPQKPESTSIQKSFFYITYSGTVTDDGEISGKKSGEEYHMFTLDSDEENYAFLISTENLRKWTSEKIIPDNLTDGETYVAEIEDGKEIQTDDKNITYYLITKLKSMKLTDEISTPGAPPQLPKLY